MGRVQDIDHDSVSCDNVCGAKADAARDAIPAGAWRQAEFDSHTYDACSATCAQALHRRLGGRSTTFMEWWTAAGARVRTKT